MTSPNIIHFLSAKGRLSIGRFWLYWLLLMLVQFGFLVLATYKGNGKEGEAVTIVVVFSGLFYLQIIKRMHDVGRSGWYCLVPIYNLILALTRGDEGANEYGPDPRGGTDDIMINSDVLDQPVPSEISSDINYSIQSELKNFLVYTVVSRLSYLVASSWWSHSIESADGSSSPDIQVYQAIHIILGIIFNIWVFVLMARSANRWLQWIYFYIIIHSVLFDVVRMLF